jgi:choline kinase
MTGARTEVGVLLVAGGGTRLGEAVPKCLVSLAGQTMLRRAVSLLAEAGVEEIVLATGYREDLIREAMHDAPLPFRICTNARWSETQNAVSLALCRREVLGRSFFKLDGDVVFRPEVLERLALAGTDAALSVAVDRGAVLGDEEMKVRADGAHILEFGKGLSPTESAGESIGIERIDASIGARLFDALDRAIAAGRTSVYYEDIYNDLIGEGLAPALVDVSDLPWTEVDTPEDRARAEALLRTGLGAWDAA